MIRLGARDRERWVLAAAGPALLLLALLPPGVATLPRLALAAFLLFVAPGRALVLALGIGGGRPAREQAVSAFAGSLAVLGAVGLVGRLLGATPTAALAAIAVVTTALAVLGPWRGRGAGAMAGARAGAAAGADAGAGAPADARARAGAPAGGRLFGVGLWILAAAAAVSLAVEGGGFGILEDSMDHLATVREILETGDLFPATSFYPPEPGDRTIDPRKGFFTLGLALASRVSGADPAVVWRWAPAFTGPLAVLAFGAFARRLLVHDAAALVAALLFALFHGGAARQWLELTPYGTNLAQVLFWSGAAALLDAAAGGGRAALARAALASFAGASVHLTGTFLILAACGAFGLAALVARGVRSGAFRAAALTAVAALGAALPLLAFRFVFGYPATNPIHTHLQGVAFVGTSYIIRPDIIAAGLGALGLAAIPLSLAWAARAKRDDAALYLVAAAWLPLLLTLVPWITPLVGSVFGYLAPRLVTIVPGPVIVAGAAAWAIGALRRRRGLLPAGAAVALLLALAVAARFDVRSFLAVRTAEYARMYVPEATPWEPEFRALDRQIPEPAVILSDPVTSYCIPAFSKHHVVSALNQHTSPTDGRAVERARDLATMMNPLVPWSERLPLFPKHGVRYVLLNETFLRPLHHFYCNIAPAEFPRIRRSFLEARDPSGRARFDAVSDSAGFLLLRAAALTPATGGAEANPYLRFALPDEASPVDTAMAGSVRLLGARIEAARVDAGGEFAMACYFTRDEGPLAPFPYEVYVRCETDFPKGALYRPAWGKLYRRVVQERTGRLYRFRAKHAPCDGIFPPADWPAGAVVEDGFTVKVPSAASPGEYTVKVIVLAPPLLENYRLSDYLSDRDYYDGITVGRVRVGNGPAR